MVEPNFLREKKIKPIIMTKSAKALIMAIGISIVLSCFTCYSNAQGGADSDIRRIREEARQNRLEARRTSELIKQNELEMKRAQEAIEQQNIKAAKMLEMPKEGRLFAPKTPDELSELKQISPSKDSKRSQPRNLSIYLMKNSKKIVIALLFLLATWLSYLVLAYQEKQMPRGKVRSK